MTKLETINAEDLQNRTYEPTPFLVDELIPEGLHILAGAPKIGKSWLALWLCLCVSQGQPLWYFATTQGEVLYLSLEDSFQRIQTRLFDLTEDAPPTLHFAIMADTLKRGLEQQIEQFLTEHPTTKLVVIDTLQCVRGTGSDSNLYANDYQDIGLLKRLADRRHIAILLIHHLRKLHDDDPMNMISGSTGLSGAADSTFVLQKNSRLANIASLHCTDRDIPDRTLKLEFGEEDHVWKLLEDSKTCSTTSKISTLQLVHLFSELLRADPTYRGSPSALSAKIDPDGSLGITPKKITRLVRESVATLMRVWLYARLSNDDDREMNSLRNQREICQAFAEQHGYIIVGQSFDDNISGMSFDRRGLDELMAAVDADKIDAVIVKDLSRLGRHRTQTALFIDYLRERQVRVISATEGVDTFRDEDDLIIGVRGLMNDYYVKDIGKKIRAGYRQKQKDGIVITPPFGYWKDKNTGQIKVDTEAAVTVQLIYSLYLQGRRQKEISRRLNIMGRKTPAQLRAERCGREVRQTHKTRDGQFLWTYASVKNILVEEAYTGVLNNHRREYNNGKAKHIDKTDWYRHEGFVPVIIGKQEWAQVQRLLKQQARPANGNQAKHRYAGLLTCRECGNAFIPMIRCWNGSRRVEYVCRGYHRNGKGYCSSHRIHEEILDKAVWDYTEKLREQYAAELKKVTQLQKQWALRKPVLNAHCLTLQKEILRLEQEIDGIVMEKLNCDRCSSVHEISAEI